MSRPDAAHRRLSACRERCSALKHSLEPQELHTREGGSVVQWEGHGLEVRGPGSVSLEVAPPCTVASPCTSSQPSFA